MGDPFRDRTYRQSGVATFRPSGLSSSTSEVSLGSQNTGRARISHFKSYRLVGEYSQPWLKTYKSGRRRNNAIVGVFFLLGLALSGVWIFLAIRGAPRLEYCLVLDDHFERLDDSIWSHEVQLDGFGTGAFDWTTTDSKNSFVDQDGLHIVPTLTNETTQIDSDLLTNGYTLNLTADGTCTGREDSRCAVVSNHSLGIVIPPVRSARLSTKGKKFIKYGRIEVVAKMPRGDWLWPAIWMMPEESKYGEWPRSGEIDIVETRGNGYKYPQGGRNHMLSTLHWGPSTRTDSYWRTVDDLTLQRSDFSREFRTYGLEWSEKYIYTWIDNRLKTVLYAPMGAKKTFWQRGQFDGLVDVNQTYSNPWTNSPAAPFDQNFYLILNVAVGSRNGWFQDGTGDKPWVDSSGPRAAREFWNAADQWLPTWGEGTDRGMTVKSVKMYQQGGCKKLGKVVSYVAMAE